MPGSQEEVEACVEVLRAGGALPYTTVVVAKQGCSLGERYAAACYACSIGEYARDSGRPALVVLDDLACMVPAAFPHVHLIEAWCQAFLL